MSLELRRTASGDGSIRMRRPSSFRNVVISVGPLEVVASQNSPRFLHSKIRRNGSPLAHEVQLASPVKTSRRKGHCNGSVPSTANKFTREGRQQASYVHRRWFISPGMCWIVVNICWVITGICIIGISLHRAGPGARPAYRAPLDWISKSTSRFGRYLNAHVPWSNGRQELSAPLTTVSPWSQVSPVEGAQVYVMDSQDSIDRSLAPGRGKLAAAVKLRSWLRPYVCSRETNMTYSSSRKCTVVQLRRCLNCPGDDLFEVDIKIRSRTSHSTKLRSRSLTATVIADAGKMGGVPRSVSFWAGSQRSAAPRFDIGIPASCVTERLEAYARTLRIPKNLARGVRILVTGTSGEGSSECGGATNALATLRKRLGLNKDQTVVVPLEGRFSRAKACNALHEASRAGAILLVTDVDMVVGEKVFASASQYVVQGASAYFPIVWSEYNPIRKSIAERYFGRRLTGFGTHVGKWRVYGYGMYAIAGIDARRLKMDAARFKSWGGEDGDFFRRVSSQINVVRRAEPGLVHAWHPKDCSHAAAQQKASCIGSKLDYEGSQLTQSLVTLDRAELRNLMGGPGVLVGVTTSMKSFLQRVRAIRNSWGSRKHLPPSVDVHFFVGEGRNVPGAAALAAMVGVDRHLVHVLPVPDNEYPPVRKNTAMLRAMDRIAREGCYDWIVKVDDDTLVNAHGLADFVESLGVAPGPVLLGQRGRGRPIDKQALAEAGMDKPFCMGGPGYAMSVEALDVVTPHLESCVRHASDSEYRFNLWHSDVVIGVCMQRHAGLGCWEASEEKTTAKLGAYKSNGAFFQNYHIKDQHAPAGGGWPDAAKLRSQTLTMHPLKNPSLMRQQHDRVRAAYSHLDSERIDR